MITSRSLEQLLPKVKLICEKHITACKLHGIDIIVTSTYRDNKAQRKLYAQGRTTPGAIVTYADEGESYHNFRCAWDVVIIQDGKAVWNTSDKRWQKVGELGESVGAAWAGRWKGKAAEMAHFQYTGGLVLADLRAGKVIV